MSVGFVGLGSMGEPMAANLARAGVRLTVRDLRPEPVERLRGLGAAAAASPRALAGAAELILVMVVDDDQVRDVVSGPDGVLDGASSGSTLIVHSTVHPDTCRELLARARERGLELLDAPVSGAAFRARQGTLSMMAGGDAAHLERWRPVLSHMAESIFHMGPVGSGLAAKLANNLVAIVNGRALEEGLALARQAGIDESRMLDVLNASSGQSFASQTRQAMRAEARAHPGGRGGLGRIIAKDIALAVALARELEVRAPLGERLAELLGGGP